MSIFDVDPDSDKEHDDDADDNADEKSDTSSEKDASIGWWKQTYVISNFKLF